METLWFHEVCSHNISFPKQYTYLDYKTLDCYRMLKIVSAFHDYSLFTVGDLASVLMAAI